MIEQISAMPFWVPLIAGFVLGLIITMIIIKSRSKHTTSENKPSNHSLASSFFSSDNNNSHMPYAFFDSHGKLLKGSQEFLKYFPEIEQENASLLSLFQQDVRRWWRENITLKNRKYLHKTIPLETALDTVELNLYRETHAQHVFVTINSEPYTDTGNHATDNRLKHAPFGVLVEHNNKVIDINPAFAEMFGIDSNKVLGQIWLKHIQKENAKTIIEALNKKGAAASKNITVEISNEDNRKLLVNIYLFQEIVDQISIKYWFVLDSDNQKETSQKIRQSSAVFEASSEAIMIINNKKMIKVVNPAFTRITGFDASDVQGRSPQILSGERKDIKMLETVWLEAEKNGSWQGEVWKRRKSGEKYPEWLSVTAVKNKDGELVEFVVISSDMTKRKQAENRIRYQANYDPLTDLPNRNLFMDRLKHGISRAKREGTMLALLFIDLDRFKYINDSYGHSVGDELLIKVSSILKECVRSSDSIARFGGDEFAIILSPIYGSKNASRVANLILERLSKAVDLSGYEVVSGGSIGISLYPTDGENEEQLVKNADTAMYRAKEKGRHNYQFFTDQMQKSAQERMSLERDLRAAFAADKLSLAFQPQMECASGQVGGLEVLMRWQNKDKGAIPPSLFIPLAEDTGLIVPMGTWIMKKACEQYMIWKVKGIAPQNMAVNVSSRQFHAKDFIGTVKEVLKSTGMPPENLELELTESLLMEDQEFAISILNDIRNLGVKISIDDFGTGYSSLNYLKKFPMTNLKVDQSFVKDIMNNEDDASIVKAIIDLGHTLNMEVIAEGVEDKDQLMRLQEYGVDFIQGYYYSKPMKTPLCEKFLTEKLRPNNVSSISNAS